MAPVPGQRLGVYEIIGPLGAGGMGEVYRARDTKLQRDVAIKVLPASLATDRDRLARFEREAQLLAQLNHSNIAAIYGVDTSGETQFLVLELVEGDTLADRISRAGALSISESIAIARQIGDALQAAHDKGIVHRDLKPANIALTADGHVKVLDFGLAKAMEMAPAAQSSVPSATLSPTISLAMTEAGLILGTAAYMSPEQAKGRPADKRSDIWAFGCVLFEMLTGKRAFEGEDASDTLAGILRGEPDLNLLPRGTPAQLREILSGCLAKDRKQRLADIAVVSYLLGEGRQRRSPAERPSRRTVIGVAAAVLLLAAAVIGGVGWTMRGSETPPVTRFTVVPPAEYAVAPTNADRQLAVSPDGRKIVYASTQGLVLRDLDRLDVQVLSGTAGARYPFWSPDGNWIGYTTGSPFELRKVSATGGSSLLIAAMPNPPRGATWGPDDTIVFATADNSTGLMRVPAAGGEPEVLTKPDPSKGERDHVAPSYLPRGGAVLFAIPASAAASLDNSEIAVLDLATRQYHSILRGGNQPQYVETGHLLYAVNGSLRAVRFDQDTRAPIGDPVPVVEQMGTTPQGMAQYSVSATGTLVYIPDSAATGGALRSLVWVDRAGQETPVSGAPRRAYAIPRLSHDNSRVALYIDDQDLDTWVFDLAVQTLTRATFGSGLDGMAVWYPDDQRFLFVSVRDGRPNLYSQRADGTGGVERVTRSDEPQFIPTMSPDGALVVALEQRAGSGNDLVLVRLDGASGTSRGTASASPDELKSEPIVATPFPELHPEISPDGRWLAYTSSDSGMPQIIVQPFPDVSGGRWQVSTEGGSRPAWSPAGKELFYAAPNGAIMAVSFDDAPAFRVLKTVKLFDWPTLATPGQGRTYDVTRDGQRFLMIKEAGGDKPQTTTATMRVVLNWTEELKGKLGD